jgi:hypothetical protein
MAGLVPSLFVLEMRLALSSVLSYIRHYRAFAFLIVKRPREAVETADAEVLSKA